MKVNELIDKNLFQVVNTGNNIERDISKVFCCDLLSVAMGRAPAGSAWVTVMGNINTLAVASLTEVAVVVLAEGAALDETAASKAKEQNITVLQSEMPVFECAKAIDLLISND